MLIVLASMLVSGLIINYYWTHDDLAALRNIPVFIVVLAFAYILLQMLKRYLFREKPWWDWLYYIGLLAMMLPNLLANLENLTIYNQVADIGTLFLVIPVIIDGRQLIQSNKK